MNTSEEFFNISGEFTNLLYEAKELYKELKKLDKNFDDKYIIIYSLNKAIAELEKGC